MKLETKNHLKLATMITLTIALYAAFIGVIVALIVKGYAHG